MKLRPSCIYLSHLSHPPYLPLHLTHPYTFFSLLILRLLSLNRSLNLSVRQDTKHTIISVLCKVHGATRVEVSVSSASIDCTNLFNVPDYFNTNSRFKKVYILESKVQSSVLVSNYAILPPSGTESYLIFPVNIS